MTREDAINVLNANVVYACEKAGFDKATCKMVEDALELVQEQEGYVSIPFSWLVKYCTHIDFPEPIFDAQRRVLWKEKLRQQFGINVT